MNITDAFRKKKGGYNDKSVSIYDKEWKNNIEDHPYSTPMSPYVYGLGSKERYYRYNIVRSFLSKYLGKKWDQSYSDICRKYDKRSDKYREFHEEINSIVLRHVFEVDNIWYANSNMGIIKASYFVHPETGILTKQ